MNKIHIYIFILVLITVNAFADWSEPTVSINVSESPGNVNGHYVMSGHRIVEIEGITFALTATNVAGYEAIWRSIDGGTTWSKWNTETYYARNGVILTGPDNYIYYYYQFEGTFYQTKFLYDAVSCPNRTTIATITPWSQSGGAYNSMGGDIDADGDIFVTYNRGSSQDGMFMLRSTDAGVTWSSEIEIFPAGSGGLAISQQMAISADNTLYVVVNEIADAWVSLARSDDNGATWSYTDIAVDTGDGHCHYYNANVLTKGNDDVFIVAQSYDVANEGTVIRRSTDSGVTFGSWVLAHEETTYGYGDPSPALAANGDIYVGIRGPLPADPTTLRAKVIRSQDNGATWSEMFCYCGDYRTATKTCMRYQTFWNYGGHLQWTWLQSMNGSDNVYQVFYNSNSDIPIMAHPAASPPVAAAGMNFLGIFKQ